VQRSVTHWVDGVAERLAVKTAGKGKVRCNGGLSVSGLQHVGRLRGEVTIVDAVCRVLEDKGVKTRHTLVLYDVDPWKGKDPQLKQFSDPVEAAKYRDWPLFKVPDPKGCCRSWVEHYWRDFGDFLDEFSRNIVVVRTSELYSENPRMQEFVLASLAKSAEIRRVLNKYRRRNPLPDDWIPFEPICEKCGRIGKSHVKEVYLEEKRVSYVCECGYEGEASIRNGKLTWRVEWVGVWYALEVDFEPYGKDHAMPGGSRDSCNELAEKVFGFKPPEGLPYEWVGYVVGGRDVGDMGSSDFIGFTPREWVEVAEPEVLRYYYLVNQPMKRLTLSLEQVPRYTEAFDTAERIYYGLEDARDSELRARSYELALLTPPPKDPLFQLPYLHAVALVQTLPSDRDLAEAAVKRLKDTSKIDRDLRPEEVERISRRLRLAKRWLELYAPAQYQIKFIEELPDEAVKQIPIGVARLLKILYLNFTEVKEWSDEEIKRAMMKVPRRKGKEEKDFFKALYLAFFGKTYGPRIAPYFSMLGKERVLARLSEVLKKLG